MAKRLNDPKLKLNFGTKLAFSPERMVNKIISAIAGFEIKGFKMRLPHNFNPRMLNIDFLFSKIGKPSLKEIEFENINFFENPQLA